MSGLFFAIVLLTFSRAVTVNLHLSVKPLTYARVYAKILRIKIIFRKMKYVLRGG